MIFMFAYSILLLLIGVSLLGAQFILTNIEINILLILWRGINQAMDQQNKTYCDFKFFCYMV